MDILWTLHVYLYETETVRNKLVLNPNPLTMIGTTQAEGKMTVQTSIRGTAEITEDSLEAFTIRNVKVQDSLTTY